MTSSQQADAPETPGAPPSWFEALVSKLADSDRDRGGRRAETLSALKAELQDLLERRREIQERALRVHRHREDVLQREVEALREALQQTRDRLVESGEAQQRATAENLILERKIEAFERELAAERLARAASDHEEGAERRVKRRRATRSFPLAQGTEDTSVANPILQPVDLVDAEQLAFQVSALQSERDKLRRDLRTMEEILEGAGTLPEELSASRRDEWRLRALAAEESTRALGLILTQASFAKGDGDDLAERLGGALEDGGGAVVALFEKEQRRWAEREERAAARSAELEARCHELRDELEEAFQQVELQRGRLAEAEGARVEAEQRQRELGEERREADAARAEAEAAAAEMRAELGRLRESLRDVEAQLVRALQARDEVLRRALNETTPPRLSESLRQAASWRIDVEVVRRAWEFGEQEQQAWRARLVEALRAEGEADRAFGQRAVGLELARFETRREDLEGFLAELAGARAEARERRDLLKEEQEALDARRADLEDRQLEQAARRKELERRGAAAVERRREAQQRFEAAQHEEEAARLRFEALARVVDDRLGVRDRLAAEHAELSERLEEALLELAQVGEELAAARQGEVEAAIEALEGRHLRASMMMDQLRQALEPAAEARDAATEDLRARERDLEAAQDALDAKVRVRKTLEVERGEREDEEDAAAQSVSSLEDSLADLSKKESEAQREAAMRRVELAQVEDELARLDRDEAWGRWALGRVRVEVEALNAELGGVEGLGERAAALLEGLPEPSEDPEPNAEAGRALVADLLSWSSMRQQSIDEARAALRERIVELLSQGRSDPEVEATVAAHRERLRELEREWSALQSECAWLSVAEQRGGESGELEDLLTAPGSALLALSALMPDGAAEVGEALAVLERRLGDDAALARVAAWLADAEQRRAALLGHLRARESALASRESRIAALHAQLEGSEREALLEGTLSILEDVGKGASREKQLSGELEAESRRSAELAASLAVERDARAALEAERRELAERLEASEAKLEAAASQQRSRLKDDLSELESRLERSEEARKSLTQRLSQVQSESAKRLEELAQARERAERARDDAQGFVTRHEAQLEEIREANEAEPSPEARKLLKRKEREIKKLKAFLDIERKRIEQLTEERSRLKKHLAQAKRTGRLDTKALKRTLEDEAPKPKRTGRVDVGSLKLDAGGGGRKTLISELEENLRRAESRAQEMAKVVRTERKRRTEALARLKSMEGGAAEEGRLSELRLQVQRMETRLRRETTARAAAERTSQSKLEQLARKLKAAQRDLEERGGRVAKLEAEVAARERRALTSDARALRLGRELEQARAAIAAKEREIKGARGELSARESRVAKLEGELDAARLQVDSSEASSEQVEALEAALESARADAEAAQGELESMRCRLGAQEAERDALEQSVREAEAKVEDLSEKLKESGVLNLKHIQEHQRLTVELDQARNKLAERESALDMARRSLTERTEAVSELEARLSSARNELSENREAAQRAVEDIERQLLAARAEVQERTVRIEELSTRVEQDQQLHEDLERTAEFAQQLVSRVSDLQLQLERSRESMADRTRELSRANSDLEGAAARRGQLEAQLEDARAQVRELEASPGADAQRLKETRELAAHLAAELATVEAEAEQVRQSITAAESEIAEQQSDATALSEQLEQTQTTLEEVAARQEGLAADLLEEEEPEVLEEQLVAERAAWHEAEAQTQTLERLYNEELERLRGDLAASQQALEEREGELAATRQRLEDSERRIRELSQEQRADRAALSEAEAAYAEARAQAGSSQLGEAEGRLEQLRAQLGAREGELEMALDEAQVHRELAQQLEQALAEARDEARDEAAKAERQQATSRAWLEELTDTVESTRTQLQAAQARIAEQEAAFASVQKDRAELEAKTEAEVSARRRAEREFEAARERARELEARLRGLELELAEGPGADEHRSRRESKLLRLDGAELQEALDTSEGEISRLKDEVASEAERDSAELLHWLVSSGGEGGHTQVREELGAQLQQRRERLQLQLELNELGESPDPRAQWQSMKAQAGIAEIDDLSAWLRLAPRANQDTDANSPQSGRVDTLNRRYRRLERAYDWARREQMATAKLEYELERTRREIQELTGAPVNSSASEVEDEFLSFYEEQLRLQQAELLELRESKKSVEREALMTLELLDQEKSTLEAELSNTRDRLMDLDQVIISLNSQVGGQELETLIQEQAQLRQDLRKRQEEVAHLERLLQQTGSDDKMMLKETRATIERLQDLLEEAQDENERLRDAQQD